MTIKVSVGGAKEQQATKGGSPVVTNVKLKMRRASFRMALINVSKWIDEERPYFEFAEKFGELTVDRFTDPDEEASTELGEVPHEETKGALRPGYNFGPYWQSYTYE